MMLNTVWVVVTRDGQVFIGSMRSMRYLLNSNYGKFGYASADLVDLKAIYKIPTLGL